jgi:hypothetical protein
MLIKRIFSLIGEKDHERGSSLIGVAIMTLALGFLMTGGIFLMQNYSTIQSEQKSVDNFRDIETALNDFIARKKRYPCPAPLDIAPDTIAATNGTEFGKEGSGDCLGGPIGPVGDGTYRALGHDPDGAGPLPPLTVRIGAVPVRSLHLADYKMMDGYGKRYIYAITEALATTGTNVRSDLGAIIVKDENNNSISDTPERIVFTIISLGEDKRGAYNAAGILMEDCDTASDAGENCDFLTAAIPDAKFTSKSTKSFNIGVNSFSHSFAFHSNVTPYKWSTSTWGQCNGTCFTGNQTRTVICRNHKGEEADNPDKCSHTTRPEESRVCSLPPCTSSAGGWQCP